MGPRREAHIPLSPPIAGRSTNATGGERVGVRGRSTRHAALSSPRNSADFQNATGQALGVESALAADPKGDRDFRQHVLRLAAEVLAQAEEWKGSTAAAELG